MKENKWFRNWVNYYKEDKSLVNFYALLNVADKAYLFRENNLPYDDVSWDLMPAHGFLEKDFRNVLDSMNFDNLVKPEDSLNSKTRLILALKDGVTFEKWLDFFGDDLTLVFARALIEGEYEKFGINFEDIVKSALSLGLLARDEFFGVALMRGNVLGKRYPSVKEEKELESVVKSNKRKISLQEKMYKYI